MRFASLANIAFVLVLVGFASLANVAQASDKDCGPCADSLRSRVGYYVAVSPAGLEMLGRAVVGDDARALSVFRSRFNVDTARAVPRAGGAVWSPDTVSMWRKAIERVGSGSRSTGDSTGALGVAVLAALDRAVARPDQPRTPARGMLVRDASGVHLAGCTPPLEVTGAGADSLATAAGTDVWLQGYCRGVGRIEWIGGHRIGRPRVDLFVMGFCPYARRLEAQMCDDLAKLPPDKKPEIAVHYLLYWDDEGPVRRVGSTHGEKERVEDAVQIIIRDEHPALLWRYIKMRSQAEVPWEMLAVKAGLSWQDVGVIQRRLTRDLDAILTTEHEWNQANYPHIDGSPTVYWGGASVRSIADVPGFTAPQHEEEKCSEGSDATSAAK